MLALHINEKLKNAFLVYKLCFLKQNKTKTIYKAWVTLKLTEDIC